MFVGHDNIGELVKMWVVRVKIWVCYGCYYSSEVTSNERKILLKNLKISRIHYNRFFSIDIKKELQNQFRNQAWRLISSKLKV